MSERGLIAITTGDSNGIGAEVTYKALAQIGPQARTNFVIYKSNDKQSQLAKHLKKKFNLLKISSAAELSRSVLEPKTLIELCSDQTPVDWVKEAAKLCLNKKYSALVTGPLSKTLTSRESAAQLGHTEIFKSLSNNANLFMSFWGNKFNVVLITGHLPLSSVPNALNTRLVESAIRETHDFISRSLKTKKIKALALVGLNPHAGEQGLIGAEEKEILIPLVERLNRSGILIEGPLVPDVAFAPKNWPKYSAYMSLYHDQGLIPFKMIHHQNHGVHVTLGLPFLRTSVDHGTAVDIFGKNKADPSSMIAAIKMACKLQVPTNLLRSKS